MSIGLWRKKRSGNQSAGIVGRLAGGLVLSQGLAIPEGIRRLTNHDER
jgi:hypothetical protein